MSQQHASTATVALTIFIDVNRLKGLAERDVLQVSAYYWLEDGKGAVGFGQEVTATTL